jgi:hypothetical protein
LHCSNCGGENEEDAAVCSTCGATVRIGAEVQLSPTVSEVLAPIVQPVQLPVACAVCATILAPNDYLCRTCRTPRGAIMDPYAPVPGRLLHVSALLNPPPPPVELIVSIKVRTFQQEVPAEIKGGWNWGAFWLPFFWGLSHRTYQTLIVFGLAAISITSAIIFASQELPHDSRPGLVVIGLWLLGFPFSVWFGLKGNEWAWINRKFQNIEDFHSVQHIWAAWAKVLFALNVIGVIIFFIYAAVAL